MASLRIWAGIAEAATLQYLGYGRLTRAETRAVMLESLELIAQRLLTVQIDRKSVPANGIRQPADGGP